MDEMEQYRSRIERHADRRQKNGRRQADSREALTRGPFDLEFWLVLGTNVLLGAALIYAAHH